MKGNRTERRFLIFLLVMTSSLPPLVSCGGNDTPEPQAVVGRPPSTDNPALTASVDFSQPVVGQKSMSGFLHGISASAPPDSMLLPLQPRLWRATFGGNTDVYARVSNFVGFKTIYQALISDSYGYPGSGSWNWSQSTNPPYDKAPYANDFELWIQSLTRLTQNRAESGAYWDVWNEPNIPYANYFWYGTAQDFYRTYATGYKTLRAQLGPDARIGGPSVVGYDKTYIEGLLNHCLANACKLDFLSWHELIDSEIPAIAQHLQDARASFVDNPRYASLGIKEIHINETVGPSAQYRPGEILAYLYYLEAGGADAAARACWVDSAGTSQCFNNTIDGLLDPYSFKPRAPWWAYKFYADGVSTRVKSLSNDPSVVLIASSGSAQAQTAQILVGLFSHPGTAAPSSVKIQLSKLENLSFLKGASQLRARVERIPDTGEQAVTAPTPISDAILSITDKAVQVNIARTVLHELYLIRISSVAPSSPATRPSPEREF